MSLLSGRMEEEEAEEPVGQSCEGLKAGLRFLGFCLGGTESQRKLGSRAGLGTCFISMLTLLPSAGMEGLWGHRKCWDGVRY